MKPAYLHIARSLVPVTAACLALSGCMTSTPIWDKHFGEATRAVMQAQIIDPQAAEHHPSTPGVDGESAVSAMTQYDKSFAHPPTSTNPYTIGVSAGTTAGSQ
ncbi:hypothetical protein G3N59_16530 [Paraburkholderia sp. Ac-20340]|uniref:hypothetical protein n=1 Tax=Paraburkholderia sp. Ac-20340 TaxID=2703888 RepID=UPI00197F07FF|nr:hypothetical protein [Paraburkholderia sp. Ac-20340]MBN3854990.1 hypothetical protein [Paraburkholderia sp. Ac-20340]